MQGTPHPGFLAAAVIAVLLSVAGPALRAEDLTTLSGQTFHGIRAVRVEPDGVTWSHAGGVVKVDFSDSPRTIQLTYGYDPAKATAYHDARVQAQRQAEEQSRQLLQGVEARRLARAQSQSSAAPATGPTAVPTATDPVPGAPTLVYRHGLADTVRDATRSLDEQAAASKARDIAVANATEGLLGDPKLWKYFPGVGSKPKLIRADLPQRLEYKDSLHSSPIELDKSALESTFFNPLYMTKTYNEDVDRAAAFARGTPLK